MEEAVPDSTYDSLYIFSISFNVQNLSKSHKIGCVLPVKQLRGGSTTADEVILPYLELFLIR